MAIAAFSTVVEWYDFTLYLYFAATLSRVFFGGGAASLTARLAGFAIACLMRPRGALLGSARAPPPSPDPGSGAKARPLAVPAGRACADGADPGRAGSHEADSLSSPCL